MTSRTAAAKKKEQTVKLLGILPAAELVVSKSEVVETLSPTLRLSRIDL